MSIPGHPRLDARPGVCGGRPTIKGTRMRVVDILEAMAAGVTADQLVADFPYVSHEDIHACLTYAAEGLRHPVYLMAAE